MRLNRHSLIFNLTAFLTFFFLTIIVFLTLANATVTKQNLRASEEGKIETVVNTIMPIVSLNLSFGFQDALADLLDSLPKGNRNILGARILDTKQTLLHASYPNTHYSGIFDEPNAPYFFFSADIHDPVTQEPLGMLQIAYSNLYYQKIVTDYGRFLMITMIPVSLAFLTFLIFFYHKLRPLKELSAKLEKFKPGQEEVAEITERGGLDEVTVINNSAARMIAKIREYTDTLNDLNRNLEQKIRLEVEKNREKDRILIRQSRQAALGEMIGNIAHQWRQPINALGLIIQDIEDAHDHNELSGGYIRKSIDLSMDLITHMSDTIDDFRNFFVPNKDKNHFPIDEAIDNALKIVGASLSNYEIRVEQQLEDHIHIYTYKNEFTQVIINILNNSKDAFKTVDERPKLITIRAFVNEAIREFVLSISDNAGGIDPAIMEKIFDPYFTTKHKDQGTGIGLYMSKSIIENNMKGALQAENIDGGARLIILLPLESVTMPIEQ
jgi:signal transduction histidine kinase